MMNPSNPSVLASQMPSRSFLNQSDPSRASSERHQEAEVTGLRDGTSRSSV